MVWRWRTVLRVSVAPRIGILLVPWLLVYSGSITQLVTEGYWESAAAQSTTLLIWTAPAVAACGAWEGLRLRQSQVLQGAPVRSFTMVSITALAPTLLLGAFAVVLAFMLLLPSAAGAPGWPSWAVLGVELLIVTAHAATGYVLGLTLPRILTVPVALVGSFVWMAYPAAIQALWVRQLNGVNLAECCSLDQVPAPRALLAPALVALGVVVTARLAAGGRTQRLLAPAILAGVVTAAAVVVQPLGYGATEARSPSLRACSDTRPRVCLWPEQRHTTEDVITWATEARDKLGAAGITAAREVSPRATTPTSAEVRSLVALSALPSEVPPCAAHGPWPGDAAVGPLRVWLSLTAGADTGAVANRYAPEDVRAATRARQFPPRAQLAWFRHNAKTLTRCDRQPALDPSRF